MVSKANHSDILMICSYKMIGFETLREVFIDFLKMSSDQINASIFKFIPYEKFENMRILGESTRERFKKPKEFLSKQAVLNEIHAYNTSTEDPYLGYVTGQIPKSLLEEKKADDIFEAEHSSLDFTKMNLQRKFDSIRKHKDLSSYNEHPIDYWILEYMRCFAKDVENFKGVR